MKNFNAVNEYLVQHTDKVLKELLNCPRVGVDILKDKCSILRSRFIDISDISKIKNQFQDAVWGFKNFIWTLEKMGFEVNPKEVVWHNVQDSDFNYDGRMGFFVLKFTFKKVKK